MQIIEGNILDITSGIICHQVNCQGVFNAGLAKQIREKYPRVYEQYIRYYKAGAYTLGFHHLVVVKTNPSLIFCNIAGQNGYGSHKQQTNYAALEVAFEDLKLSLNRGTSLPSVIPDKTIYIPYGMGCGLAGGDWNIVSGIIDEVVSDAIVVRWANA